MKKILIIESNDELRENTSEILELNNYQVAIAKDGNAGFEMAREQNPDLILCDILMPESKGRKFFKMAKEDLLIRDIPIVFFSSGIHQLGEELNISRESFLKKPFSEQELLSIINSFLASS
jgi:CheY-like chemotaxis protein